jgi:predicted DNA repair protein MutK
MAGASLLALLDDIAAVLDDVSVLTKVAAKKTAGVLGDDLALNAQQVSGVNAHHELPVVWAVFKGSSLNKLILVPAALAISAFVPWLVTPLLMVGGLYLCYEGVEKLAHKFLHGKDDPAHHPAAVDRAAGHAAAGHAAAAPPGVDPSDGVLARLAADEDPRVAARAAHLEATRLRAASSAGPLGAAEKNKIKGAVRTDFILSAEIIAITLGTVAGQTFTTQLSVLVGIAAIMTIGVYGLVAGIVKLDDAGLYLSRRPGSGTMAQFARRSGFAILAMAPYLMKGLSIVGTAAMFLVGGGILTHGFATAHHWIEDAAEGAAAIPGVGVLLGALTPMLLNALAGIVAGGLALLVVTLVTKTIGAARGGKPGAA